MILHVEDNNEVVFGVHDDEVNLRAGDTINIGTSDYEDLTNKPSINEVELIGDKSSEDLGLADAEHTHVKADITDFAHTHTKSQITDLPNIVSDVKANNVSVVTDGIANIPPLVTDLGNIDPSEYEDDRDVFLNTLLQDGAYRFVWEDGDDYEYYVVVESMLDYGYVYQKYWYSEEGSNILYHCSLIVEDGEVVERSAENYMTLTDASIMFAIKNHAHYETVSKAKTVWDYCDDDLAFDNGKPFIIYADTLNNKNWLIERYSAIRSPNQRYIRLYDLGDASHFFLRSGLYLALAGVIAWENWEEYPSGGGMNITVDGTNYPITAINKTAVGGVSGVLVDYDDGNGGQLFFADGDGLSTVKSAIEGNIPHDTSELTNGAGFLTISDLPIYNGGVS